MKLLLTQVPPFSMRAFCGAIGVVLMVAIARWRGEALGVPAGLRLRLLLASLLNVTAWMGLATLSLLWLAAGEATIVCYTVPVWASLLAWPVLGERLTPRRVAALAVGLTGLAVLVLGRGVAVGVEKLPGVALALAGAVLFSLGTVITKRWPLPLPPVAATAWQLGLGCLPLLVMAVLLESPDPSALTPLGWGLLIYGGVGPLGLCYLAWFAALHRLPASAAATGTLLTPVVGVLGAAVFLGEPLGMREIAALCLTATGVALAVRG